MKTYVYEINSSLQKIITQESIDEINSNDDVLIQLFTGKSFEVTKNLLLEIKNIFPHATIITASTDGEIFQENILTQSHVLSISTFKNTKIKIAFSNNLDSFSAGKEIAQQIITENTKLIISFANGLLCNGEEFIKGINSISSNVIIAGGLTGDNAKFEKCYIGVNENLHANGAVGISLNSDTLEVNNLYNFGWNTIGLKHTITKSLKNRVYTIDNISAVNFYRKYLGDCIADELPKTGIEFPLLINTNDFKTARAVIARHDDGSLSFAGNINEGEEVYLGIGEINTILSSPIQNIQKLNVESFFIYSCMARRRFIPDLIYQEIKPFAEVAPTSGFFTYGEFYTKEKAQFLNQTLTAVALSEASEAKEKIVCQHEMPKQNSTFTALMHIINVTSKELHEQTLLQENISYELAAKNRTLEVIQNLSNLGSWELDVESMKVSWSETSYKIHNLDPKEDPPSYIEFLNMVVPEDRKKFIDMYQKLQDGKIHSIEIKVKRHNDHRILTLVESGKLLYKKGMPFKIVGTTLDITDIKMQDTIMMQQSKAAQMGEMINMIAHQWRQPLNAISSAVIKLDMQNSMDILTKEELHKTAKFIEDMTQQMSQTINDFMNFTKPTHQKELIDFDKIFKDIFKIIGTQLNNLNISVNIEIEDNVSIYTYKQEIEHILMNLITNARDALEELENNSKRISIKIYTKNHLCIIKIIDNAGGIHEDIIDRVFDPYFTTKESNKGTGLGLYMSKKILQEYLNGNIFVRNKNDGAEFTIIMDIDNE